MYFLLLFYQFNFAYFIHKFLYSFFYHQLTLHTVLLQLFVFISLYSGLFCLFFFSSSCYFLLFIYQCSCHYYYFWQALIPVLMIFFFLLAHFFFLFMYDELFWHSCLIFSLWSLLVYIYFEKLHEILHTFALFFLLPFHFPLCTNFTKRTGLN